jgi:hypothetical protein
VGGIAALLEERCLMTCVAMGSGNGLVAGIGVVLFGGPVCVHAQCGWDSST